MIDLNRPEHRRRPEVDQRPKIMGALEVVTADDHDSFFQVLACVQNELGEAGRDITESWAQRQKESRAKEFKDVWCSLGQGRGLGIGTLYAMAEEQSPGWRYDAPLREMSPEEVEARRRSREEAARKNAEEAARIKARARAWSAAIITAAQPARPDHPYLVKKGVSPAPTMREIDAAKLEAILEYSPRAGGEPLAGRVLVIPLERFGELGHCTVEMVDESGRKAALAGPGTKTGAHGRLDGLQGVPDVVVVGEGGATTLTGLEALRGHNAAAFMTSSNTNMPTVAKAIRAQYPGARIIILADLVKATGEPDPKAVEAAQAVNGSLAVPDFGPDRKYDDKDFNDLARVRGPEAVRACIEGASLQVASRFEFLDRDDLMRMPDTEYVIKPLFPSRGVIAIHGPSGTSKSFLALDQAASITEERPWLDEFRVKRRPVAFLVLEGMNGMKKRVRAWEKHHGRTWPKSIKFIPRPKTGFDLRVEKDVVDLIADLKRRLEPGTLLYIDTLAQAMPGSDESNSDYGLALAAGERIGNAIEGAVVLLAHPGKDPTKGIRGGYNLFCGLDANMELVPVPGEADLVTWVMRKAKDGEAGIERRFRRIVVDLGTDADGDPVNSCVIEPVAVDAAKPLGLTGKVMTRKEAEALVSFKQAAIEYGEVDAAGRFSTLPLEEWRSHFYLVSTAQDQTAKRVAFNRAKSALIKGGWMADDIYGNLSLIGPGAEVHVSSISEAILENGRAYQCVSGRNNGVTDTPAEAIKRNVTYHPPLRGVTVTHGPGVFSEGEDNSERTTQKSTFHDAPGGPMTFSLDAKTGEPLEVQP